MDRYQADAAEQTAWRTTGERPAWHFLGLAIRNTMARPAQCLWPIHDLLSALRSLAAGWCLGSDHGRASQGASCVGSDDRHVDCPRASALGREIEDGVELAQDDGEVMAIE
jgi:hypothetical protein